MPSWRERQSSVFACLVVALVSIMLAAEDPKAKTKAEDDPTAPARRRMVERHLVERGIKDPRVLDAFRTVPRHKFLPKETRRLAFDRAEVLT